MMPRETRRHSGNRRPPYGRVFLPDPVKNRHNNQMQEHKPKKIWEQLVLQNLPRDQSPRRSLHMPRADGGDSPQSRLASVLLLI